MHLAIRPDLEAEVRILKELTWYYVIESPSLVAQRFGQRALIRSLFRTFCEAAETARDPKGRDVSIFPLYFRERLEQNHSGARGVKRIVADLISGMSETQVVAVHQRLTGESLGSARPLYPIAVRQGYFLARKSPSVIPYTRVSRGLSGRGQARVPQASFEQIAVRFGDLAAADVVRIAADFDPARLELIKRKAGQTADRLSHIAVAGC